MVAHLPSLEPPGEVGVLEVGLPPGHLVPWAMTINLFQNAKILENNRAVPPRWISPYIKPGSKRFLSWDKCRGLNFALEVGPFCVVSLVTLQKRGFEELATICARLSFTRLLVLLGSKCLVMFKFDQLYMATTCRGRFFLFSEHFFFTTFSNELFSVQ